MNKSLANLGKMENNVLISSDKNKSSNIKIIIPFGNVLKLNY